MGMMVGMLGSLSTFYDNARDIGSEDVQELHIRRLMGMAPVAAAAVYRQSQGLPVVDPDPSLGFCANFLKMMFEGTSAYKSDPCAGTGAGSPSDIARRPRTELQCEHHARRRQQRRRPLFGSGGRPPARCTGRRMGARMKPY